MPSVNEALAGIPAEQLAQLSPGQLDKQREFLLRQYLNHWIEVRLIRLDAERTIPPEGLTNIKERLAEQFEAERIAEMMKAENVRTRRELDEKLRKLGTSLERKKRAFIEQTLAQSWAQQQINLNPVVSHDEILAYYREHAEDFETPARARWEQLTVRIPRYSDGKEAYAKLGRMGNELMQGRSLAEVLKAHAGGTPECRGGVHDWTEQGSLELSDILAQAVFGLPVGQFSKRLRDGNELHIVRVLQREEPRRTPFVEAQVEIRETLTKLKRKAELRDYLARLREEIPVWTVFDDEPGEEQLSNRPRSPIR